jgi:hypothetical protein
MMLYNCDDKYFPGHKCKEHKLFMAISEDVSDEDVEVSPEASYPKQIILRLPLILPKLNH